MLVLLLKFTAATHVVVTKLSGEAIKFKASTFEDLHPLVERALHGITTLPEFRTYSLISEDGEFVPQNGPIQEETISITYLESTVSV